MNKNNLGIIGAGYWSTNIIKTLEEMNVKHVHVYDNEYYKLLQIKKKFKYARIYDNEADFFSAIKNVIIATPPSTHYQVAKTSYFKKHSFKRAPYYEQKKQQYIYGWLYLQF